MEREIVCLDTSILIDYFRKKSKEETTFYKLTEAPYSFAVTSITTFEIYRGVTSIQKSFWDSLFDQMDILPFDERTSIIAASLLQRLNLKTAGLRCQIFLLQQLRFKIKLNLLPLTESILKKLLTSNYSQSSNERV